MKLTSTSPPSQLDSVDRPLACVTAGYALFQAANNAAVMTDIRSDQRGVVSGMLNLSPQSRAHHRCRGDGDGVCACHRDD
jgi:hypothetical protein